MKLDIDLECGCGAPLMSEFQPANNVVVVTTCVKCTDEKVDEKLAMIRTKLRETIAGWGYE